MARFAPVVPIQIAQQLQTEGDDYLGGYHLLLAHDIIDKPKDYKEIYGFMRRRWRQESFIILDNSIIELGKAMEIKDLLRAADILRPDCIVIPDVMGDGEATREKAVKFARQYAQECFERHLNRADYDPPSLMGVLQGHDVDDVMQTSAVYYALPIVDYIGIPRILTKMHGSRMPTLMALQASPARSWSNSPGLKSFLGFHLLGFSDDILDDVACARVHWIQGIDSAVPIRAATKEITVSLDDVGPHGWSVRTGPRGDFWNSTLDFEHQLPICRKNLDTYRSWIKSNAIQSRIAA